MDFFGMKHWYCLYLKTVSIQLCKPTDGVSRHRALAYHTIVRPRPSQEWGPSHFGVLYHRGLAQTIVLLESQHTLESYIIIYRYEVCWQCNDFSYYRSYVLHIWTRIVQIVGDHIFDLSSIGMVDCAYSTWSYLLATIYIRRYSWFND